MYVRPQNRRGDTRHPSPVTCARRRHSLKRRREALRFFRARAVPNVFESSAQCVGVRCDGEVVICGLQRWSLVPGSVRFSQKSHKVAVLLGITLLSPLSFPD
jgi:hypothetical protein